MLTRVFRALCPLRQTPAVTVRYLEQKIHRIPLRYVDSDGAPVKDELDVDPDPKPVKNEAAKKRSPRAAKQRSSKPKPVVEGDTDTMEFLRNVTGITARNSKKDRAASHLIVLEGEKLISDAFDAGLVIRKLYHDRDLTRFERIQPLIVSEIPTKKVTPADMAIASKLTTPPGLMAIAERPAVVTIDSKRPADEVMPVTLIGDTITEPGNTGGILRSMAAAGASNLILSEQSSYAWDVKVLRVAAGAHFLVPIRTMPWDAINSLAESTDRIFFADCPCSQRTDIPAKPYYDVKYFSNRSDKIALFLGSESRGFCPEAEKILISKSAQRITIPMSSRFDSLNNYVAASVILFEMRKQYEELVSSSK